MIADRGGSFSSRSFWLLLRFVVALLTLCVLALAARAAPSAELSHFRHPTGVFSLSIPKDWGPGVPFAPDRNVFTFKPSTSSELTIAITQNLRLPSELPMTTPTFMFPDETPISTPVRERGAGWNSLRQDFEKKVNGTTRVWLAKFYGVGANAIAITLSDTKENIGLFRAVFEEVTRSIAFHENR